MKSRWPIDILLGLGITMSVGLALSARHEASELRDAVAMLEARPTGTQVLRAESDPATSGTVDALVPKARSRPAATPLSETENAELLRAAGAALEEREPADGALDLADPEVRMKLRDVIAEEQQLMRDERWSRRQEQREVRMKEEFRAWSAEAGLDDVTATQVEDLLVVELAEVSDLFRKAREEGNWDEMRERIGKVRSETEAEAIELMGEDEAKKFLRMREEEASRWSDRGRRGRDRGRE